MCEYMNRQLILHIVLSKWHLIPSDKSADGAVEEDYVGGDAAGDGDALGLRYSEDSRKCVSA